MYLHHNQGLFTELIINTESSSCYSQEYILKDYFAVMLLKEAVKHNPSMVFKGGTCLSKCYQVINRFSEDVDLGLDCLHASEGMRKRMKQAIVAACENLGLEITNPKETRSRREFNRFEVAIPNTLRQGKSILLVETAVITPASPTRRKPVQSFIGEYCEANGYIEILDKYNLMAFDVIAASPERTFCDKIFAVCDYYLSEEMPDRQSRHIYDLYKLIEVVEFNENIVQLFSLVRQQRLGKHGCYSASPQINIPETLKTIVASGAYEKDYLEKTQPLLYENVAYEQAVQALMHIAEFLGSDQCSSLQFKV